MTVDFGTPKTAYIGKTALTKQLLAGRFAISTLLDISAIRDTTVETCETFPKKHVKIFGDYGPAIMNDRRLRREVISYGSIRTSKRTGNPIVLSPEWKLVLVEIDDDAALAVAEVSLTSGKISYVEEMQYFLNELEINLRKRDSEAYITFQP